jgi:hypothetical protein
VCPGLLKMGWQVPRSVNGASSSSTARPMRRSRGTSTGRCRPISWGVDTVGREHVRSLSVSVPPSTHDLAAPSLAADPASHLFNADVVSRRIDLERLYGLTSANSSTPEAARAGMERDWRARSKGSSGAVCRRKTVARSAASSSRPARTVRSDARQAVPRRRNTVLAVAEQFLQCLEQEVSEAESRYAQARYVRVTT